MTGNVFSGLYSQDKVHCPKYTLFNLQGHIFLLQGHIFLLQGHKVCQKHAYFNAWGRLYKTLNHFFDSLFYS
jgi:hypothetical protein